MVTDPPRGIVHRVSVSNLISPGRSPPACFRSAHPRLDVQRPGGCLSYPNRGSLLGPHVWRAALQGEAAGASDWHAGYALTGLPSLMRAGVFYRPAEILGRVVQGASNRASVGRRSLKARCYGRKRRSAGATTSPADGAVPEPQGSTVRVGPGAAEAPPPAGRSPRPGGLPVIHRATSPRSGCVELHVPE